MAGRWSEVELQLIRDVFKDEQFILAVRDVMMGFTNEFTHKTSDQVLGVLRKSLLPTFEAGIPLEMQQDLCLLSLDFITGFNAEQGILRIEAFDLAVDYLERRLGVLHGIKDVGESLNDLKNQGKAMNREDRFVRMLAYLRLGGYIEKNLGQLALIAKTEEVSPAELKKRQEKNSNK